jgi:hypothetical protein
MFDGVFGPATEKTRLKNSSRASPFGSAVAAKGASMRRLVHIRARAAILDLLNCDRILRCYEHAAGSELLSGKFASPESSAALAANTFGFFLDRPELLSLPAPPVAAGAAQSVCFETEMRFPWRGGKHPWLDVVITTGNALIGKTLRAVSGRKRGDVL